MPRVKALPTIVIDTREQTPWRFPNYPTVRRKLDVGDYAIDGAERALVVERKELFDFIHSVTVDHDRFDREVVRAQDAGTKLIIIVEGDLLTIKQGKYPGVVLPQCVLGAVVSLQLAGVPVLFASTRALASEMCERQLIYLYEKLRAAWREEKRGVDAAVHAAGHGDFFAP